MVRRRRDARALVLSILVAALIIAQQVGSKAVRDALFLSYFPASNLPQAMIAAAILSVPAVLLTSLGMARLGPAWMAPAGFGFNAALFALEWALLPRAPRTMAAVTYLHVATLGGTVISAFWSVINERFDPYTARRGVGRITAGASVGGFIGGLLVNRTAGMLDPRAFLLAFAITSAACAVLVRIVAKNNASVASDALAVSGFSALKRSSYLRAIAGLVTLVGLISAVLDYAFKARASAAMSKGPELVGFFAAFYMGTSVLAAVLQTAFARRALDRLGLAGTLAVLPSAVLLTGVLGAAVPRLWTATLLRGAASVLESSFFRSGYEPLYTPLPATQKRASKTIIDVAGSRLGDALGGGLILLVLWAFHTAASNVAVIAIALLGAASALWLTFRIHHGYVAALASSLRTGSLLLREDEAEDRTTRLAISQTQMEIDREQLLSQLVALRSQQLAEAALAEAVGVDDETTGAPKRDEAAQELEPAALLATAEELLSRDPTRVRAALGRLPLDVRLLPLVIPLLEHGELALPVTAALRSVSHEVIGQLVDALVDTQRPVLVRRRLPRVLSGIAHPRAVRGLVEALHDTELEVRRRTALALAALTQQHPELAPPRRLMFDAAHREVRGVAPGALDVQHVFVILSLALDREALELARRALTGSDDRQRGTALEYLETVLPEPLRSELWPHLRDRRAQRNAAARPAQQVLDELKLSSAGKRPDKV